MLFYLAETVEIRTEEFQGREHKIIPVIGLVEGVLQAANSPVPEFIPASVMAQTAASWNGRPVVVDHPKDGETYVSANSPDVLEAEQVGTIFNATMKDSTKLFMEAWVDVEAAKIKENDRINAVVEKLEAGELVEISTGFFGEESSSSGEFNGEHFEGVVTTIVPDHLAILSETQGACSIKDGCGANRANSAQTKGKTMPQNITEKDTKKILTRVAEAFKNFKFTPNVGEEGLSDNARRDALQAAIEIKVEDCWPWVVDVYENSVVYITSDGFFRRTYEISEDGSVTLGDEIESVRPETEYVPVKVNEVFNMSKKTEKVDGLIANAATQFTEDHKEWLLSLEDVQLDALEPVVAEEPIPEPTPTPAEEPEEGEETSKEPVTAEQFIAEAPPEIQEVLQDGINRANAAKTDMITRIKANKRNKFTDVQLNAYPLDVLQQMADLANDPDYSGQGAPRANVAEDPNAPPTPPALYPVPKAANQ